MQPRKFALWAGIVMLVLGLMSFIPNLSNASMVTLPELKIETSYGLFLGIFAMNIFNKVALVVFGLLGIVAASMKNTALPASIWWARLVMVVMGAAAVLGAIPQTRTLFGYWPLFGNEIWLHGLFALIGAYYGYVLTTKASHRVREV